MSYVVGSQVVDMYGNKGFIAAIKPPKENLMVIGGNGMESAGNQLLICFYEGQTQRMAEVSEAIAAPWFEPAERQHLHILCALDRESHIRRVKNKVTEAQEQARKDRQAIETRNADFKERVTPLIPSWAQAAIVAEMEIDDCDSMTDYFNVKTGKRVLLGFSKHTRDLFPELRKAALNFEETAPLHDAPQSAENREKYSMGKGYYLKAEGGYRTGWSVRKIKFYNEERKADLIGYCDLISLSEPATEKPQTTGNVEAVGTFTIEQHVHTKKGFDMWICTLEARVDRSEYDRLFSEAKGLGGWYSRKWGTTPAGFAFKSEDAAKQFAENHGGNEPGQPATDSPSPKPSANLATKFRDLAEGMQKAIDSKFADRRDNTPKRAREAGEARNDGRHLQRTQTALRALADLHESDKVPAVLANVKTKARVHELTRMKMDHSGGYYDVSRETGEPATDTPESRGIWELITPSKPCPKKERLRELLQSVRFGNIPGYFPTQPATVETMFQWLAIDSDFDGTILEPSAGSGGIADMVRERFPNATLDCIERHASLAEILTLKGHTVVQTDFLTTDENPAYDLVLMNPPFEKGQDMTHVMKAYQKLNEGGTLVSVMGAGVRFKTDNKTGFFKAWADSVGGHFEDLPDGSFKESGTGVNAVLFIVTKTPKNVH